MAELSPCDSPLQTNSVGQSSRLLKCTDCLSHDSRNSKQQISSDDLDDLTPQPAIFPKLHQPSDDEIEMFLNMFEHWLEPKQIQLVEKLVSRMSFHQDEQVCLNTFKHLLQRKQTQLVEKIVPQTSFHQHEHINSFSMHLVHRDFITGLSNKGLHHITYKILLFLNSWSLCQAEQVCVEWNQIIADGMLWKKSISQKVHIDPVWKKLSERREWGQHLTHQASPLYGSNHQYFRKLYPCIIQDIQNMEENWRYGIPFIKTECVSEDGSDLGCLHVDDYKIVTGWSDNTIKIWDRHSKQCTHVLRGHTGEILCLQHDEKVIISGSSDFTIRVWDVNSGQTLNILTQHHEAVVILKFRDVMMVTCSENQTIAVWKIKSPTDIMLLGVLVGHSAIITAMDFDDEYIVSGSTNGTITVWQTRTGEFVRTFRGHGAGVTCLQCRGIHAISGSLDRTIRIWNVESGACLRRLGGHEHSAMCIECIGVDDKRLVSSTFYGTIKVWDLEAALDPRTPTDSLLLRTLHDTLPFSLQLDNFQIVSSHHDGTILTWDFLDFHPPVPMYVGSSSSTSSNWGHSNPACRLDRAKLAATPNCPCQEIPALPFHWGRLRSGIPFDERI